MHAVIFVGSSPVGHGEQQPPPSPPPPPLHGRPAGSALAYTLQLWSSPWRCLQFLFLRCLLDVLTWKGLFAVAGCMPGGSRPLCACPAAACRGAAWCSPHMGPCRSSCSGHSRSCMSALTCPCRGGRPHLQPPPDSALAPLRLTSHTSHSVKHSIKSFGVLGLGLDLQASLRGHQLLDVCLADAVGVSPVAMPDDRPGHVGVSTNHLCSNSLEHTMWLVPVHLSLIVTAPDMPPCKCAPAHGRVDEAELPTA